MSLKKKIIISFLISSVIIAMLAISAYVAYVEIRKDIRFFELSDTIRSKSLLLRRHEKNFFLYGDLKEVQNVYVYIRDLKDILNATTAPDNREALHIMRETVIEYERKFNAIENLVWDFQNELNKLRPRHSQFASFFPLIESTVLERPLVNADVLVKVFSVKRSEGVIRSLRQLNAEIGSLRKYGEEMLTISSELDKAARARVEKVIRISQTTVLVLFPLFLVVGLLTLFAISQSVVKRLQLLTAAVEKAGRGDFSSLPVPDSITSGPGRRPFFALRALSFSQNDEVGRLISAFIKMENDLTMRDDEIKKKNEELFQSRKLASIGTLASGVAHELNNPLNNIYLAAQILSREAGDTECSSLVKDTVKDIFSQTLRVKRIVSDLLEFAREKAPELRQVDILDVVRGVLSQMTQSGELYDVRHEISSPERVGVLADRHLLQQVFINLFANAVDAMNRRGLISIAVLVHNEAVEIAISDSGKGIEKRDIPRIFDPFFTTKEKGTGLGLAIVYSIIRKHNGRVEVASELDKGTTFTITLPRES